MAGLSVQVSVSGHLPFVPRSKYHVFSTIFTRTATPFTLTRHTSSTPSTITTSCVANLPIEFNKNIASSFPGSSVPCVICGSLYPPQYHPTPISTKNLVIALNQKSCDNRAYTSQFQALHFSASYQRRNPHQGSNSFVTQKITEISLHPTEIRIGGVENKKCTVSALW
jgi:hypothetical protein